MSCESVMDVKMINEEKTKSLTQEENRPNSNDVKGDVQVCGHSVAD